MHEKPILVRETQTSSPLKPDAEDEIHSPLNASGGCNMMNLFGIKSYIHHFYDKKSIVSLYSVPVSATYCRICIPGTGRWFRSQ